MSMLPIFSDKSCSNITENIKRHLLTIEREIASALDEQNDSNINAVAAKTDENDCKAQDWVRKVTTELNDLFNLLEDLDLPPHAASVPTQKSYMIIASLISLCNLTLLPQSTMFQLKQVEQRLDEVAVEGTRLSLKSYKKSTVFSDAEDQEIIEIVGRKDQKEGYVRMILGKRKVKGVVPVVVISGIHGMGKTKLAKYIWDDERIQSNFDLMIWIDSISIHEKFYSEFVVKRIIHESAMKKKKKLHQHDSVNLREALSGGTRFFLLLDDLRNEDSEEWNKLIHMLREAPHGGAVVITTQSEIVAKMVFPSCKELRPLTEDYSWDLFKLVAGRGGGGGSDGLKILDAQKKMVKMCCGVPIAIITMARLVSSHHEAKDESEIYQSIEDEFKQEMQLRYYNNLPSSCLKRCFAYCSFMFSTINYIRIETLIRFWMAEGFLGPVNSSSQQRAEDLGLECIQEFRRRSIILCGEENEYGILTTCFMNVNLMPDLSEFVSGEDNLCIEDLENDVKERVQRVLVTSHLNVSNGIPKSLFRNNKNLSTIMLSWPSRVPNEIKLSWSACDAIFSGFKRLRVLTLRDLGMKILPRSIGELKSLRYLSLAKNNMKKLPNSIGQLKHLLTLILSDCHELKELPYEMKDLVSLRHLSLQGCLHLEGMPSTLKKLTWLQRLSNFVASTNKKNSLSGGLWELIGLNNLRGELEILHLERLHFSEPNQDGHGHAYLREKEHLQSLILRWNHDDEDNNDGKHSEEDQISLAHLEPHPNLQGLSIVGYEGIEFSNWLLSKFINLVKFSLYNCSKCKKLPPLDQLPKLKILQLQRLDSLEFIIDDHDNEVEVEVADSTKPFFPSLRELVISDCPNLTSWWKGRIQNNAMFHPLSKLEVSHCPKLDCMPFYPNVHDKLSLICSNVKSLRETLNYRTLTSTSTRTSTSMTASYSDYSPPPPLSKLKELRIEIVEEQPRLPEEWLKNFNFLNKLSIECKSLKYLMKGLKYLTSLQELYIKKGIEGDLICDGWEVLINLRNLHILEFPKLKSLPEGIKNLTSLKYLRIDSCPELVNLTEGISNLRSLTSLCIEECYKLASLPKGMSNLKSLRTLRITNCPRLFPRCQKETGDDWPQIKHIKQINLFDTSEYND